MKRGFLLSAVAILLVGVPAVLLVWMRFETEDRLSRLDPDPVPVLVQVEQRDVTDATSLSVVGTWGDPDVISAPSWFGTVTRLEVDSGAALVSGDAVARIDSVDRIAVRSIGPFWRSLRRRDVGDDVAMLQMWLSSAGFYDGEVDGEFGRGLQSAVKDWAMSLGVKKSDGSFDPGWIVWLPVEPFDVARVEMTRGTPAPGQGSEIIVGPVPLESVSLVDRDGHPFTEVGEWILEVDDVEVSVVDGSITPAGLLILETVLDVEQPSSGMIMRSEPLVSLVIPATAVVSNASGDLCVFVPDGLEFVATPVELLDGRVATVNVASGLEIGDEVLANPADMFVAPSCP